MYMIDMINTGIYNLPGMSDVINARKQNADNKSIEGTAFEKIIANRKKECPYEYLSHNGVINYNGVTFVCDTKHNKISLGDVETDKSKVINVALPSGGNFVFNVDNVDDIAKAASMFTPEDLNAIMKAVMMYKHCQEKMQELEDEENSDPEENAMDVTPEDGIDNMTMADEQDKLDLIEQLSAYQQELYYKILNGETERAFVIGAEEFTVREWDKFVERFDESEEYVKESMEETNAERQEEAEKQDIITEEMIEKLLEDRDISA